MYLRLFNEIKKSQSLDELNEVRKRLNLASIERTITYEQEIALRIAIREMTRAHRCRTFLGVYGLEVGYSKLYADSRWFCSQAKWFFMMLFVERRMKLFNESDFGKGFSSLFEHHPKLILASVQMPFGSGAISASGRGSNVAL